MSEIPRLGKRLILALGTVACLGVLIQIVNARQIPAQPNFIPADHYNTWQRSDAPRTPPLNALRGVPSARYYIYQSRDQPPVFVSIARADTLDAYRPPFRYMLDEDGRVGRNQERYETRAYEERPLRILMAVEGRSDSMLVMHWTQIPGEDPMLDPTDAPTRMLGSLLTKKPIYICDAWIPTSSTEDFSLQLSAMKFVADNIDRQIKALPK